MIQVSAEQFQQMQQALQHVMAQQAQQQQQAAANAAASAAAAARPKLPKIPPPTKFRGESGFRIDEWLRELQRQFDYYNHEFTSDQHRIKFAVAFVEGLAAQWWTDYQSTLQQGNVLTWNQFVAALHARFRPLESALVARQTLEHLQQGSLSVDQYAHRFQAVLTSIKDMSEADKLYRFVMNLRNGLKQKVLQEGHKTLRDAIQSAASHEAAWKFSRTSHAPSQQRTTQYARGDSSGNAPMDLNNVESDRMEEGDELLAASASSTSAPPSDSALNALLAKLTEHMDQRINAVVQQRRGGNGQRRSSDKVPGLTQEEFERCLRNGLCLHCKQHGHMKRDCPQRSQGRPPQQGK